MSDDRRRARERLAAQGGPEAAAAAGRAVCRTDGCDVRARIARDEGGSPWIRVEVGPGLVHAFPLTIEDTAAEWAVTLNCDATFRVYGFVAVPGRASLAVHGARCPRCGDPSAPVAVDGVASRGAQPIDTTIHTRGTYPTGTIDPATLVFPEWDGPRAWPGLGLALDDEGRFRPAGSGDEIQGFAISPVPPATLHAAQRAPEQAPSSWTEAVRSDPDDTPARGSQASNAADPGHRPAAPA